MYRNILYKLIVLMFVSFGFSQRVMLITKTNDMYSSSNEFTIDKKNVTFWEGELVLMTVPIRSLVEVRYAEKSYFQLGNPCVWVGTLGMASAAGASVAGQFSDEILLYSAGGGVAFYFMGKILNAIGARFGRDIVYQDFDRLDSSTKHLVLETVNLDMKKRKNELEGEEFYYGPEGKRDKLLFFTWDGKRPWKKKYKPKKKIVRFSWF